ncbi:uncharacterized protein LOC127944498 isoform X2 [Carassius gibelio]|uniref:uncharacterized protein LOC127944498 isoform X2 n=1 Tax=Carassius gibelio TaxID=101364 RepID=UPI00227847E8|nr:uncharacterized protein LOC127944498 isoform X2 [Carassius gibelio]
MTGLETLGVQSMEDLFYLREDDLLIYLRPVQCRRLICAFTPKDPSSAPFPPGSPEPSLALFSVESPQTSSTLCYPGETLSADTWMMSIEGTIVMGPHNNLLNGVAATFAAYYVFNLHYPKDASSTLEFVQRAFCGINSQLGSKAEKRHGLNAPVCTLLRKLLDFELMG